ncbi:IS66 family transposase zinc-finger binding domain-containing protein [Sorangium sp. So ce1153]
MGTTGPTLAFRTFASVKSARHVTSTLQSQAQLPADLADVRRKLEQLAAAGQLPELIELVLGLLLQLRDKNTALSARLASALRELYGRKSQQVSTEQLMLMFAELGAEAPPGATGSELGADAPARPEQGLVPQPPEPPKPPRGRGGRAPLPEHLPRETRVVPVSEARRTCPQCGADKKCIGHRTSEVLEFVPAQFKIIEEPRRRAFTPSSTLACSPRQVAHVGAQAHRTAPCEARRAYEGGRRRRFETQAWRLSGGRQTAPSSCAAHLRSTSSSAQLARGG